MPRRFSLRAAALLAAASACLCSCGRGSFVDGRDRGEWRDGAGVAVAWSPKKPAIGDLVHLEAQLPTTAGLELKIPGGQGLPPIGREYRGGGLSLRWSFRVKAAGDYGLGATSLWSVSSVAGQATELRTHGADALWSGKASREASQPGSASPEGPAKPASPALPAPSKAAPAVPQANT